MPSPDKGHFFSSPSNSDFIQGPVTIFNAPPASGISLRRWKTESSEHRLERPPTQAPSSSVSFKSPRCREKGCIFPATSPHTGWCEYHERQEFEPSLFRSEQPSTLVLEHAKFGPSDPEAGAERMKERRQMARLWEQFQENESV